MSEVGFHRVCEILKYASRLLAAGFYDRQDRGYEPAAMCALRAKRKFAPDDGMPQRAFAGIVRRLDTFDLQEGPKPLTMTVKLLAHAGDLRISAEHSAQQEAFHLPADQMQQTQHARSGDRPVTAARPLAKQLAGTTHEIVSQPFH